MNLKTLRVVNFLIGACDAMTGLLLIFVPHLALALMRVSTIPSELIYLRYIGVFVFGVGASYFLPLFAGGEREFVESVRSTWRVTALLRFLVGGFVSVAVVGRALEGAWVSVAITDVVLATIQVVFLKKGIAPNAG